MYTIGCKGLWKILDNGKTVMNNIASEDWAIYLCEQLNSGISLKVAKEMKFPTISFSWWLRDRYSKVI